MPALRKPKYPPTNPAVKLRSLLKYEHSSVSRTATWTSNEPIGDFDTDYNPWEWSPVTNAGSLLLHE